MNWADETNQVPDFQFGFRKGRNTLGAVSLLYEAVLPGLTAGSKKKDFACFIDLRKAFDSVNRKKLFEHLQKIGLHPVICELLLFAFNNLKISINSGGIFSKFFETRVGTPQDDSVSPSLFSLYLNDIEDAIVHEGPKVFNHNIGYLLYADDLVLLATSQEDLSKSLCRILKYFSAKDLVINVNKTKVMVFALGRPPKISLKIGHECIEKTNSFNYLGLMFTPQLSFSNHLESLNSRAKSRAALLFHKFPLLHISIEKLVKIFIIFVVPIYEYGLTIWWHRCSRSSKDQMNSVFTIFLKRWLGVPRWANNAKVHHLCETKPLEDYLSDRLESLMSAIYLPEKFSGFRPSFLENVKGQITSLGAPEEFYAYLDAFPIYSLPATFHYRRGLARKMVDYGRMDFCQNTSFHAWSQPDCKCKLCDKIREPYHNCQEQQLIP